MRTVEVVQAELDIVNGALQSIYAGTKLSELRIDTNVLRRYYKYVEITPEALKEQKLLLEQELMDIQGTTPTFRAFGLIPIVVGKTGIY